MTFTERLRFCRKAKNVSQKQLAIDTGLSLRAFQYYESGKQVPSMNVLIKLADYFDVSVDYLVGRTDKPNLNR